MDRNKILILIPGPDARGGITNYYYSIRKHLDNNYIFLVRGARKWPYHSNIFKEFFRIVMDNILFLSILLTKNVKIVQTSTSLTSTALIRDSIYLFFAKVFRLKTVIFFRGWDPSKEQKIKWIFRKIIFASDAIIVLSEYVKSLLIKSGYKNKIYAETTLVDVDLLKNVSAEKIVEKYKNKSEINLLFMARIEKAKGIYQAIDTFKLIKNKHSNVNLFVAGSGRAEEDAKNYVRENQINNVFFTGFISGDKKIHYLESSHIYIFPSYYIEGMPNSVLEAMAFGLPVISRNVGGLLDIIKDYENGFITDSFDPLVFAELISKLLDDTDLMIKIALNNFYKAQKKFRSDIVAERLKKIFEQI